MKTFGRIANASAAVALGGHRFVVADDERKYLTLYDLDGDGKPIDLWKFKDRLNRPVDREPDLEGAAMIGATIFWISSHGTDSHGRAAPDRAMLFATLVNDRPDKLDLQLQGEVYSGLLDDMQADPTLAKILRFPGVRQIPPKQKGGISIEGLAATPDNGLLIGFRNPLVRGLAVVVEVRNPFGLISGRRADFVQPIFLDLGERGIRSIDRIGNEYLIIAGPYGSDHEPKSALFHWSGSREERPINLNVTLPDDFNPEAVFAIPQTRRIVLLSDDGRFYRGEHKRVGEPEFRTLTLDLDALLHPR